MPVDATLVLGGGVREGGALPPWVESRFDLALQLHEGEPMICLSAGTTHRPPALDARGFPIFESAAGARYLVSRGIPPERILVEACSYDTIGNALFARLLFTDPRGWRRLRVITSAFHMPRTEAVFRWVFALDNVPYVLSFHASGDTGLTPDVLDLRRAKEQDSLRGVPSLTARLHTIAAVHAWLFSEHNAYAVRGLGTWAPPLGPDLAGSY